MHFTELALFVVIKDSRLTPVARLRETRAAISNIEGFNADLNATDSNNDTALTWAAYLGHEACVKLLVESGANVESTNVRGNTALDDALEEKHLDVIHLLLTKNAILKNPQRLLDDLLSCNINDPEVRDCLNALHEQQKKLRILEKADEKRPKLDAENYQKLENHVKVSASSTKQIQDQLSSSATATAQNNQNQAAKPNQESDKTEKLTNIAFMSKEQREAIIDFTVEKVTSLIGINCIERKGITSERPSCFHTQNYRENAKNLLKQMIYYRDITLMTLAKAVIYIRQFLEYEKITEIIEEPVNDENLILHKIDKDKLIFASIVLAIKYQSPLTFDAKRMANVGGTSLAKLTLLGNYMHDRIKHNMNLTLLPDQKNPPAADIIHFIFPKCQMNLTHSDQMALIELIDVDDVDCARRKPRISAKTLTPTTPETGENQEEESNTQTLMLR